MREDIRASGDGVVRKGRSSKAMGAKSIRSSLAHARLEGPASPSPPLPRNFSKYLALISSYDGLYAALLAAIEGVRALRRAREALLARARCPRLPKS